MKLGKSILLFATGVIALAISAFTVASCVRPAAEIAVTGVTVSQPSLSLEEGETATISYTVQPKDATTPDVSFSSSDTSVATVSNTGIVTAVAPGTATITVKTKDGGFTATVTITVKAKAVAVTGISLDKTELTLKSGEKATLTATVTPANATDKSVTWTSSDPPVAAIDNGEILAGKPGTATITVKTKDGGKTATCKVTVESGDVAVTGVSLDKTELTLKSGGKATLTATVTPEDATDKTVTWTTSDAAVVAVDKGEVLAGKPGKATITVKTNDGGKTATCSITVEAATVAVTGVSLDKTELSLTEGGSATLKATVTPEDATDKTVSWKSSDSAVATVDESGKVTAVKAGSATITVTTKDGSKTATCKVTVTAATVAVTGVSLDKTELSLTEGGSATLKATVTPEDATDKTVSWKSSDSAVATVDENGKVTAVKAGSATITVTTTDGGKTATCKVTVTATSVDLKAVYVNSTDYLNFSNVLHFKNGSNYRGVVNEFLIVPWNTTLNQLLQDSDESHYTCSSSNTSIAGVKVESLGSRCAFCVKVDTYDPTSSRFCDLEFTYKGSGTGVTKKVRLVIAPAKAVSAYEYDIFTYNGSSQGTISDTYTYTLKSPSDASFIRLFTEFKGSPSHYAVADNADMASYSWSSSNTSVVYITEKATETGDIPYPELSFTGTGTSNVKYSYTDYWGNSLVKNIKFTVSKSFLSGGDFIYKHDNSTSNRHFINVDNSLGVTLMKDESTAYKAGEITGLTWTSSNSAIATVTKYSSNEAAASISGKAPGDATITVTAADGSSRSYFVTVYKGVDKITPNSTTYTLGVGSRHQIKPGKDFTITPSDATYTAENDFKWRSSNTGVLTVSSNGQVTGVSEGTTYVQASPKPLYQWWADARQVRVVMPYLQVINHSGSPAFVARLAKEKVNIPANGEILMAPGEVVTIGLFDSKSSRIIIADGKAEGSLVANTSIASINSIGYNTTTDQAAWISLEGKASGTTELRVRYLGDSGFIYIPVKVRVAPEFVWKSGDYASSSTYKTSSTSPLYFSVSAKPTVRAVTSSGSYYSSNDALALAWSSSDTSIATVDNPTGCQTTVTLKKGGLVAITGTDSKGNQRQFWIQSYVPVSAINGDTRIFYVGMSMSGVTHQMTYGVNGDYLCSPGDATFTAAKDFIWSSTNTAFANIDKNTGLITFTTEGVGETEAIIKANARVGGPSFNVRTFRNVKWRAICPYSSSKSTGSIQKDDQFMSVFPVSNSITLDKGSFCNLKFASQESSKFGSINFQDADYAITSSDTSVAAVKATNSFTGNNGNYVSIQGQKAGTSTVVVSLIDENRYNFKMSFKITVK